MWELFWYKIISMGDDPLCAKYAYIDVKIQKLIATCHIIYQPDY